MLLPSRYGNPWAPGFRTFRGWIAAAHMLAHLRIAGVVTSAVARLATDLAGYSLVARDLHPMDDLPSFVATAWCYSFPDQHCPVAARMVPIVDRAAHAAVRS
jgi:hypothetical protein